MKIDRYDPTAPLHSLLTGNVRLGAYSAPVLRRILVAVLTDAQHQLRQLQAERNLLASQLANATLTAITADRLRAAEEAVEQAKANAQEQPA